MEDRSRLILISKMKGLRPDLSNSLNNKTNEELNEAIKILKSPKIVEPAKLKLEKEGNLKAEGLYNDIVQYYNMLAPKDLDEIQGKIRIKGSELVIPCDIEVVRFCKALLLSGRCFDEERATACQDVFGGILSQYKTGYITNNIMYKTITEVDYYSSEIKRACKDILGL